MKILIISHNFLPILNPRSTRATELAKGFAKRNYEVTVITAPFKYDYSDLKKEYGIKLIKIKGKQIIINNFNTNITAIKSNRLTLLLKQFIKPVFNTFNPSGTSPLYLYQLIKILKNVETKFDLLISNAHPVYTHIAVTIATIFNSNIKSIPVKVAEYGDPLYGNPVYKKNIIHKLIDKSINNTFDYISTPTLKAVKTLELVFSKDKIKVIPQGFNFTETKKAKYSKNKTLTFAYAGVFYEKIRNPKRFFEYLTTLEVDFKFIIYSNLSTLFTKQIIAKYKNILQKKLEIRQAINRHELIYELSKFDFLINQNNISKSQTPSKLIDYALTGRPIYSYTQKNFKVGEFKLFLEGDYTNETKIDIKKHDINNVVKIFENLF